MSHFRLSRFLPRFLRGDKDKRFVDKNGQATCSVLFLDDTELPLTIKPSNKGQLVLDQVFLHLSLHEKDYFGLRFVDQAGQTHWLDPNKSLSSQLKACSLPFTFYFGVKFYAADPCKLREEITRYLFFLQVKRDILQGRLPVTFDEAKELCAYAVQSELGDYDPNRYTPGYISEFRFLPNQTEDLEDELAALHKRLVGQVPAIAEYRYLEKVKWLEMYGVDLHPVLGEGSLEYFLGLTPTGIVVYKNKAKIGNYFWPRISKVTFKGKVFIIKVKDKNNDDHSYAFELQSKAACKHLWKCCVEHHAFFRLTRVHDGSNTTKIFSLGSKHRYSGRTERQAQADQLTHHPSNVIRVASRRQQRRTNSDSRLNQHSGITQRNEGGHVTMVMAPEPVRAPRHRSLPELQGAESPKSTRSAPWENNIDGGLYTSGKDSPISARSEKMLFPRHNRAISGSDSESGVSHRRKYFPSSRKGSDGESDVSVPRRRRREGLDSGSESDISYRYMLQNRRSRQSNDVMLQDNSDLPHMLFPFGDKENRANGSVPSLHSAPGGDAKQRRRRRRSKSPGNKRPPEELKKHFEYDLVETEGMTEEQLKDIPFVTVETKAQPFRVRLSPRTRQKAKIDRHRSFGETDRYSQNSKSEAKSAPPVSVNHSASRTKSYSGLSTHLQDNNLPPSGYGNYSNNYQNGRPPHPGYRGQNGGYRDMERENSASSVSRRNNRYDNEQNGSRHNGTHRDRHGDSSSRRDKERQNVSSVARRDRKMDSQYSAGDYNYRNNFDELKSQNEPNGQRRSLTGDNSQVFDSSNYSNPSERSISNRHRQDSSNRYSSYSNKSYEGEHQGLNGGDRSYRGSSQENYSSQNYQTPEYAVPERPPYRNSNQMPPPPSNYNPQSRSQSSSYNSYPRNNSGINAQTTSPRSLRHPAQNNNNNNKPGYQPDYNHRNPGNDLSYRSNGHGDYFIQNNGRMPHRQQMNSTGNVGRAPATPPRCHGYTAPPNVSSPSHSEQSTTNRSLGSSINSEVMSHMMKSSRYHSDLCTEL